jgi:SAM-dependent methyltransferase
MAAKGGFDMRRQVWALYTSFVAGILSVAALIGANPLWAAGLAILAVVAWKLARAWQHQNPIPMPYSMRWTLFLPRGHSPQHLKKILEPRPGERILEIGPGIGTHAFSVAAALLPDGILDVLDIQQEMLDDLKQRAVKRGVTNIIATHGDAQKLPYPQQTFDAVYMITVLGEIPDQVALLSEVRRVLKPRDRLVIAEAIVDPDYVSLSALEDKVKDSGFVLERTTGSKFSYFALFRQMAT